MTDNAAGVAATVTVTATVTALGFRPVDEVVEVVDAAPYVAILTERFGIAPRLFDDYLVFRPNAARLAIVGRGVLVPCGVRLETLGMPFFYLRMRNPRPTTAAAIRFGATAMRNVIDLDERRIDDFIARRDIFLAPEEVARLTGPGYVLGRYRGAVIGLGHYQAADDGDVLLGMVPRSWPDRRDDALPFPEP